MLVCFAVLLFSTEVSMRSAVSLEQYSLAATWLLGNQHYVHVYDRLKRDVDDLREQRFGVQGLWDSGVGAWGSGD